MKLCKLVSGAIFLAVLPGAVAAAPMVGGCPAFPADNIWNARVDTLPVHPRSAAWVANVQSDGGGANRTFHMDFDSVIFDGAPIGIPFVLVPGSQAKVSVLFTDYGDESDSAPNVPAPEVPAGSGTYKANYPIPNGAPIEGVGPTTPADSGGDRHTLVIDTTNCILYETGNTYVPGVNGPTWSASGGAVYDLKVNGPLRPETWTSADAAGLPIFPGLARFEEVNAGVIEHALRFTAQRTQKAYLWPARHQASSITNPDVAPMGARFRLKASKDISAFPPQARIIAQAMKTYGIILADNGSSWFVSGAPNPGWDTDQVHALNPLIKGSDFEAVDVSSLMVSVNSGQALQTNTATTTTLASSPNPSAPGQNVTFTATVTGANGTPTGTITFSNLVAFTYPPGTTLAGCENVPVAGGTATCNTSALPPGSRHITAWYSGDTVNARSTSVTLQQIVTSGPELVSANPATLAFGGQSMNTTSPSQSTTFTNNSGSPVTINVVAPPQGFATTFSCANPLPGGASCVVNLTFTPNVQGAMTNFLAITYAGGATSTTVALTGTGERSLVTHYYRSILRRAPDTDGKAFWEGEATRVAGLGASINETWFAMAQTFFFSPEYAAFNRDNTAYVTDLYNTFFNRAPDSGGLAHWVGQLGSGLPREVALAEFMFSTEFRNFTQAIFGNVAARAEVNSVVDFYRGLLARTADNGGFAFWVGRFRTAQCQNAAAVTAQADSISSAFVASTEYTGRNRTNAQYIGDLYNAFLRRGGDLGGVQFWIGQLGTQTREQVRIQFRNSAEFQARVNAIIAQGCLP